MVDHAHQGVLQLGPQLDDELVGRLDGEGRCDEADVQRSAEGHQHVDRLAVVQADDGVHALGELGANWQRGDRTEALGAGNFGRGQCEAFPKGNGMTFKRRSH